MRVVIVGASELGVETTRMLVERGAEVVLVDHDRDRIDDLSDDLDCSFLHGDGSRPDILEEAGPKQSDLLFALTDNDQDNIIASLVGRSLGFEKVVTRIGDLAFEAICLELGLENIISPTRTISRYLADMARGIDILELHTIIRGEARFFTFEVNEDQSGKVSDLELEDDARIICAYREEEFRLVDSDDSLEEGDKVVVLTHSRHLKELRERLGGNGEEKSEEDEDGEE